MVSGEERPKDKKRKRVKKEPSPNPDLKRIVFEMPARLLDDNRSSVGEDL